VAVQEDRQLVSHPVLRAVPQWSAWGAQDAQGCQRIPQRGRRQEL